MTDGTFFKQDAYNCRGISKSSYISNRTYQHLKLVRLHCGNETVRNAYTRAFDCTANENLAFLVFCIALSFIYHNNFRSTPKRELYQGSISQRVRLVLT